MLLHLSIRNVVLIETLDVDFGAGLCVLTGETGAGKSILLDALGLALGRRAESRLIRQGEAQASVTAEFDIVKNKKAKEQLKELAINHENIITIIRHITVDGRSRAFLNDVPVGQGALQQVAETLVEIHGQHEQRGLLSTTLHRRLLDLYGGLGEISEEVAESFRAWKAAERQLELLLEQIEKARAEEDYLRHVHDELVALKPEQGEETALAERRSLLQNHAKLLNALESARAALTEKADVLQAIHAAERVLDRSAPDHPRMEPVKQALDRAGSELREALSAMESLAEEAGAGGDALDAIEQRLFALRAAARKYQKPVDELAAYCDEIAGKFRKIAHQGEEITVLEKAAAQLRQEYAVYAKRLTEGRCAAAAKMEKAIEAELKPLKMASCRFRVSLELLEEAAWGAEGMERVEFEVSTNQGMPFGALGKIASGGELSRLMLALKVVLAGIHTTPTLIFDEIDTGVGGAVADAVGKRLARLGEKVQVLCVTHLPQVASYGAQHLKVEKLEKRGVTSTRVRNLAREERQEEIARMLAGDAITEEARAAAGKLMESR